MTLINRSGVRVPTGSRDPDERAEDSNQQHIWPVA